jgi:SAM-dependent methyltransferase
MAKKNKRKKRNKRSMADKADPFRLYQDSVQNPLAEIHFFNKQFKRIRGRKPLSMKEDFCGTAWLTRDWVASHKKRTGVGVDLDGPTLDYARNKVVAKAKKNVRDRVELKLANVLDVVEPKVDITCALNFSYCIFKSRDLLRRYFTAAREGLNDDGLFICELYGGSEAIMPLEEEREQDGFDYVWDQAEYNPITNETLCHIHFQFPDGSRLEQAFTYDWRLWTIPEVRECMLEAGFKQVQVLWDPVDDDDEDDEDEYTEYRLTEKEENQEGWLVYFIAVK